jgi:hypothetical protein
MLHVLCVGNFLYFFYIWKEDFSFVLVNGDVSEFIISESIYVRYTDSWLDIGQSYEKSYVFYNGKYYWMNFNGGVDNE